MKREVLQDVNRVALRLAATYPSADLGNPLDPLDDLIYIILSGQTNEGLYQATYAALRAAFPSWQGLSTSTVGAITKLIESGGLAIQKATYLKEIMIRIEADWGGPSLEGLSSMPTEAAEKYLAALPGVGIKTARCVLLYTLNREVFPADTHCLRIMDRLGWIDSLGRRAELMADQAQSLISPSQRRGLHVNFLQHGRAVCTATSPKCEACCLKDLCENSCAKKGKRRPTVVDLCCGAGGFSWGFMQAGFDVLLGVDTCKHALQTYAENIPGANTCKKDVSEIDAFELIQEYLGGRRPKVVVAGPPCQGFSRAGPRKLNDPRNRILGSTVKVAVRLQPDMIVVENVLNLRSPFFAKYLRGVATLVRSAGYRYKYSVLDSAAFGVPQKRKRIVFIATRIGSRTDLSVIHSELKRRQPVAGMTVDQSLADLICTIPGAIHNHEPMNHKPSVVAKIAKIKPGEGPLSYRKLNPAALAATLVCGHRALPCHYAIPRTITTREAARIQGFPDDFVFFGPKGAQMLQVANAVPPRLALGVALSVASLLVKDPDQHAKPILESILGRQHIAVANRQIALPNPLLGDDKK